MNVRSLAFAVAALSLAACAKQELLHDLDERDANEVVVLLDRHHISSQKLPDGEVGGNKGTHYKIQVASGDSSDAWRILTENHMPQKKDNGYAEVFATAGLIPTSSEEKAKMLAAIEGELARTIKSMDGILDARVHVVIPEDSVLKVKEGDKVDATAAVWFQYEGRVFDPCAADLVRRPGLDERVMLGTINDVVVGFCVGHLATLHNQRTLGIITELYVELEGREIGVGDALITEQVESFRSRGAIGVDSWALPGARLTKNFYEAHHFTARALTLHHRFVDRS